MYRDNRYIDINKLKGEHNEIKFIYKTQQINKEKLYFSADNTGWYLEFSFEKLIGNPEQFVILLILTNLF